MNVLLAPDQVELLATSDTEDGHGWRVSESVGVAWSGNGNLQLDPPTASPTASESGGGGPFDPRHTEAGSLYVAEHCPVVPGGLLRVRGRVWVAEQVQTVLDPTGTAGLTALVVRVSEYQEVVTGG